MTSELADPQRLLQAGIQAAKAGDRARARELLLRAVELDEKVALTWIWLSEVMDDPADKVTALENALVLDPDNTAIKNRLSQLLAQVNLPQTAGLSPPEAAWPAAPEAQPEENTRVRVEGSIEDWRDYLPEVPLESDDGIDDPYQCPYCGRMTGVTDSKCPHCKGRLYFSVSKSQHSEFLRFAQLLVGISLGTGIAGLLSPLLATNLRGSDSAEYVLSIFGVQAFFGDFQRISPAAAAMLIQGHLLRAAVMLGLLLLLSQRWAFIFYSAIALMLADLLWNTYLLLTGYLGPVGALLNMALALGTLVLLFASDREFPINAERLLTQPDPVARSALDFYKRGHDYRKKGMWALAVAQWRRAVGLAPMETQYYKDLSIGYAKIGRYDRSLRVLAEAQRQAPGDKVLAEIMELVQAQAAKEGRPRG